MVDNALPRREAFHLDRHFPCVVLESDDVTRTAEHLHGLDFTDADFRQAMSVDCDDWNKEILAHDELFIRLKRPHPERLKRPHPERDDRDSRPHLVVVTVGT